VLEHDTSLAHLEFRRQRYARLSRRCVPGRQPLTDGAQQQEKKEHEVLEPVQEKQRQQLQHTLPLAGAETAAASAGHTGRTLPPAAAPSAEPSLSEFAVDSDTEISSDGDNELAYAAPAGTSSRGLSDEAGSDSTSEAATVRPRLPARLLKKRSEQHTTTVLRSRQEPAAGTGVCALEQVTGLMCQLNSRLASLALRTKQQQQQQQEVLQQGALQLAALQQAAVQLAQPALPHCQPCAEQAPALPPAAAATIPEPASALAVPAANSSLLLQRKRQLLEQQVGCRMDPLQHRCCLFCCPCVSIKPPVPAVLQSWLSCSHLWRQILLLQLADAAHAPPADEQLQEARRRAATAATALPPGARIYTALPPPPDPQPANGDHCRISHSKAAALAGAKKQLGARWVAEQQELRPALEDLWVAAERLPQRTCLPALPTPLGVPLPCGRRLAAAFLGLKL
jgi:hypothetical protein